MKTIEPVVIWDNGANEEATVLNTFGIYVILGLSATFSYELYFESPIDLRLLQLRQGQLTMTGEDYLRWSDDDEYAWSWVAQQLNLTITGEYVPPVPPTPDPVPPTPEITEPTN